ncbi:MAG TPA: nucleoside-diphosphate kinase [bacterium]
MANESTLVIFKPDAIQRGQVGAALSKLEPLRLEILGAKTVRVSRELAEEHYQHLKTKPFFEDLIRHLSGEIHGVRYVLALVLWGPGAVERVRQVTGATHPEKADPQSIRGSLGRMTEAGIMENVIHASATPEEAEREIALWFAADELLAAPKAALQTREA